MPSAYMSWLEKRPWILRSICFGNSSQEDRELLPSAYPVNFHFSLCSILLG